MDQKKLEEDADKIINALAAGLSEASPINLLPAEIKKRKKEAVQKMVFKMAAFATAAIFSFLLFMIQFQIHDYKKRLGYTQMHLKTIEDIADMQENIQIKETLIKKIQQGKIPADGLLKALSGLIPNDIILDELDMDQTDLS